jgi:ketosteroid isomerase-like protein
VSTISAIRTLLVIPEIPMKVARASLLLIVFSANLVAVPCFGQDAGTSPKEAVQRWAKALTAKEPAELLRFYAESEDLIVILSSGHQFKGYAEVKKVYEKSLREIVFFESEVAEVTAQQLQDMAWVTCRHRARFRVLADDDKFELQVRTTFVLKRQKNEWRIVLEHSSPIADVPRIRPLE